MKDSIRDVVALHCRIEMQNPIRCRSDRNVISETAAEGVVVASEILAETKVRVRKVGGSFRQTAKALWGVGY